MKDISSKFCKKCNLAFKGNEELFPLRANILKDGTKKYTRRQSICLECYININFNNYKGNNLEYIRELKNNTPCKDCNKKFPYYIMHFDHLKDKKFNIALNYHKSLEELKNEIAKCELVCANCHAERTYQRKTTNKLILK